MSTNKEILLKNVPKDCLWEDTDNLENCPIDYVLEAMEESNKQERKKVLLEQIKELESLEHVERYSGELGNLKQSSYVAFSDVIKLINSTKRLLKNI